MAAGDSGATEERSAFVFAPDPVLTITIEPRPDGGPELHVHAGGQGCWIGRMAMTLGLAVRLCGPFGGETGGILTDLIAGEGIDVRGVPVAGPNGSYIHDRRGGTREVIVEIDPIGLSRHEADDLYGTALGEGMSSSVAVLAGSRSENVVPVEVYTRLVGDLRELGVPVIADLSGATLSAALRGGLTVLKVSHTELVEDGFAASADVGSLGTAMERLHAEGAETVVVSRAGDPALALVGGELWEVPPPPLRPADHRGAGDSMTAGIAVAVASGACMRDALKLGAAAGALNVTRRGLGSGQREVITKLADTVVVRPAAGWSRR
ncbi:MULTISPECIES: PfkB family carbohydrate kinase [Rhodococcus]|uniref:PfkB family carbohydrate kinase n=1 Tax=Rhodococcus TaxID=1827 RepID=UPI001AE850B9|nr:MULTISPECIES: PfkB family carbohydrate kinase [Rhodococcus]MBP1158826.1 1-phosphofructokinase [Rhodococcus sp. PvR099]MCZ4558917.1 PfkB family carbohydrate kinase [Rhodococcus maanshanensis]